jgi:hypothetical protein
MTATNAIAPQFCDAKALLPEDCWDVRSMDTEGKRLSGST